MNKKFKILFLGAIASLLFGVMSCSSDDDQSSSIPLTADIFYSIDGKQVAFQAITNNASGWVWDFGDGKTSRDKNPVYKYAEGGFYKAILVTTDRNGVSITKEVDVAVDVTPYVLLTGGATATNGKTWKLASGHSANDYFANADLGLSSLAGTPNPLPSGVFGQLGMGEIYDDEFTFYFDGNYSHNVKSDNATFSGYVYQYVTTGGAGIVNDGGKDYGLCTGLYTPETSATFSYAANEDFEIASIYGTGGKLTYENVSTLDFSGTEFIGIKDFENKVIIQSITSKSMRLVMFLGASEKYIGVATNALVLTFEVVE
ncbi:PKD domain-containing protein [Confluentibacter sediminis]|uniref:PKD domain-containing protein n=1 Tax=Confluentibacter sediminis TaxID=2219045 RepID=UPI000DABAD7F|nr:PKD domain-containing protein [Confluentibacter sediminis]